MLRRYGLLAGMIFGLLLVTSASFAQGVSVFQRHSKALDHQYAIQITGGGSTYLMDDVNDFRMSGGEHTSNSEDAKFGANLGLAILFRSHENFRWTIGYTYLGSDRAYSEWKNSNQGTQEYEQTVKGSEFYAMGSYLLYLNDNMHFSFGAGPAIYSASLDRAATLAAEGNNFRDASGRSLGLRSLVGFEWLFTESLALHVAGGFRYAFVKTLSYDNSYGNPTDVEWGKNKMAADFTGGFAEIGLRMYFQPATRWWKL